MKPRKNLRVLARFRPTSTDDLDSELISLVGTEAVFYYHRFVEDEEERQTLIYRVQSGGGVM